MKILIAEDDFISALLYNKILKEHTISIVLDGIDFIQEHSSEYDLFIIDLYLRRQSSYEIIDYLVSVGNTKPILVISAIDFDKRLIKERDTEISVMRKPILSKKLLEFINLIK